MSERPLLRGVIGPWLFLLVGVLSLPAVTTRLYASDEVQYFAWLHSWWFDRDADFENEYQYFYDNGTVHTRGFRETFLERTNEAGRRINFAGIGTAVLWTPFYAAGHAVARLTGARADGLGRIYVTAIAYGSAIYGLLGLFLSIAFARRVTGRGPTAAVAVLVGSPLLFYMYAAPGFSHACEAFAVALLLYVWIRVRDRWTVTGALALGLAGGLVASVREQDVFFLVGPAVDFLVWAFRARRDWFAPAAAGLAGAMLTYAPQLAAYIALNGHPSPDSTVQRKMSWTAPHFFEVLFSPEHGLFFWTPLALVAVGGLVVLAARTRAKATDTRWIAMLALLMFVLQVYVSGSVESWTVAGSFGQRRFVGATPLLVLGLAAMSDAAVVYRRTVLLGLVVVLCVWWNLGLAVQFGAHMMDRQGLSLRSNAQTTFVHLPRMAPSLLWRYFFDRSSFFGAPQANAPTGPR